MKKSSLILITLVLCFNGFSQNGQPAEKLFSEAVIKAKKESKNIFIIFTATWCSPCKYLKQGIHDVYNVQFFENNYVILELYNHEIGNKKSSENHGADSILAQYKGDTTSVPYWLILNSNGKRLYGELGFSNYPKDLTRFIKTLKATSHLKDAELQMIYDRFNQISRMVPESE